MLHHTLLTVKSFTTINTFVPLLAVVYAPNMASKILAPPKSFVTHRTLVRFLTIVYSPNVYDEMSLQ